MTIETTNLELTSIEIETICSKLSGDESDLFGDTIDHRSIEQKLGHCMIAIGAQAIPETDLGYRCDQTNLLWKNRIRENLRQILLRHQIFPRQSSLKEFLIIQSLANRETTFLQET